MAEAMPPPDDPHEAHAAPGLAVPLRAGPLRLVFDRGELRWIRLGQREVVRGIYVALREEGWATVPAELEDLEIEAEPESFRIRFRARHRRGRVLFEWDGRVDGGADGRITYRMSGTAGSTFLRNRIGFCVLHPAEECAGRECIVETTDGDRLEQFFPTLVAPHQPFHNVRAILQEVTPGVEVEVRMEGETFETEDQRNWSDASFKTYGTPLHLPLPVEVKEGTTIDQSVTVSLFGVTAKPVRQAAASVPGAMPKKKNSAEPVVIRIDPTLGSPRPRIGLGGAADAPLSPDTAGRLRSLKLDHVRADLRLDAPGWEPALERAVANARGLDVPLELALFLPDDPGRVLGDLARRAGVLQPPVSAWFAFRADGATTADGDVARAREALAGVAPGALFGGGTDRHFAQLNRSRSCAKGADRLAFALTPQVHAFDDATLFENTASLGALGETLRSFAGGASLAVSPVTLRPRVDPRPASSRGAGDPPFSDDPRQASSIAAAWTLAFVAAAAEAGFVSLTFFELVGPRGVLDGGTAFPVFHAFADLAALSTASVLRARSRRPERVRAQALGSGGRIRLFLANLTTDPHPVRLEGLAGPARRAALGSASAGDETELALELGPHEIARVDAELTGG